MIVAAAQCGVTIGFRSRHCDPASTCRLTRAYGGFVKTHPPYRSRVTTARGGVRVAF